MEIKVRYTPQEVLKILARHTLDVAGLASFSATDLQILDYNNDEIEFDLVELTLEDDTARMFQPVAHILPPASPETSEVSVIREVETDR